MAKGPVLLDAAARLQGLVRARGGYDHVTVHAHGVHLLVQVQDEEAEPGVVARATALGAGQYALGFKSHTGLWEPLPVQGPLEDIAAGLTDLLSPYLDPDNLQ